MLLTQTSLTQLQICIWSPFDYLHLIYMKNDFNTRYEKILFKNGCFSVIHLGWFIDVLIDWCIFFSILPLKCGCFIDSSLFQESVWTMEPIFICLTLNGNRQKFLKETAQKPYKMNILARPIHKKESLIKFHKNVRILRQVFFLKKVPPCVSIKASGKIPETFIGFMWGVGSRPWHVIPNIYNRSETHLYLASLREIFCRTFFSPKFKVNIWH